VLGCRRFSAEPAHLLADEQTLRKRRLEMHTVDPFLSLLSAWSERYKYAPSDTAHPTAGSGRKNRVRAVRVIEL